MRTIQKAFPENGPTAVREEIVLILTSEFVGANEGQINKMYDYRTAPNKQVVEASITQTGGIPFSGGPMHNGPYYDFALDIRVRHDNTPAGLRDAEIALGELTLAIWKILHETPATTYRSVTAFLPDSMPGNPREMQDIRIAYMFIRVNPN